MNLIKNWLPLIFSVLFICACSNPPAEEQSGENLEASTPMATPNDIIGKWELVEGYRNGRLTESLTDTYFEFFMEGNMRTNLGTVGDSDYILKDNIIAQSNDRFSVDYTIEEFGDSTLVLSMIMRNFPFLLKLKRVAPEEAEVVQ